MKFIQILTVGELTQRINRKGLPYQAADVTFAIEGSIGKQVFTTFTPDLWSVEQLAVQEPVDAKGYHPYRSLLSPAELKAAKAIFDQAKIDYKPYLDELGLA